MVKQKFNLQTKISFLKKLFCLNELFFKISFLFVITGCTSISKKPLTSLENLSFHSQWTYFSPRDQHLSFSSLVLIKGDDQLKLNIFKPLIGVIGSFILNKDEMILLSPLKREYYKAVFDSKIFFPKLPTFPSSWLIALLRGHVPKSWKCQKQKEQIKKCKTKHFTAHYKYKNSKLTYVFLKDSTGQKIQIKIKNISSPNLSSDVFQPELKNWKKEKTPFFFQKD